MGVKKHWPRSVINLRGPGLSPSVTLLQSSCQSTLTRCQRFWCNLCSQTAL